MLAVIGCNGAADQARQKEESHLRALVTVFNFAESKLGHRPANEAEFKAFIQANAKGLVESLHLGTIDELFVSERDGQPFVVLYGSAPKGEARDVIAYEQNGVSGKRLVGYSIGAIAEVDENQFAKLAPTTERSGK